MELKKPESLNKQEIDFCELFIFGCDPYAGNARKCYEDIFYDSSHTSLRKAKQLMARDDVQEYINQLRAIANYETADLKARLTEKLLHIIDETSTAKYTDRRGTELSPAPLRSVAVQASKALMEMYPVKVAQESKVELKGNGDSGIVFNVIVPQSPLLKEWKLKKLIGRDGVIIKENQTQKTKGVWVRLNEPFANELEWFIPIQSVQITSH